MAIGMRQVRAIGLIAAALLAVAAVSFTYLQPPAEPHAARATTSAPSDSWPQAVVVQQINLTGRLDGGYFVWARPGTGSGGHGD